MQRLWNKTPLYDKKQVRLFTIPQDSQCEMTPEELSKLIEKWEDDRISMTKDITPR